MKVENLKVKYRGKTFERDVAIPDSLSEALSALGDEEVFRFFLHGYLDLTRKDIRTVRVKKYAHIDLTKLEPEKKAELKRMGLI